MNPLDQLELDVLALTGDIDTAEMAGLIARQATDDLLEASFYMLGFPPAVMRLIRLW